MEFALREKVVVYLRERGENYFGYHLRDVESQIAAPQISDNEWISELSIVASAAGIDIDFETPADILVETRQELRDGEPYWSISLRKSVIPEQNATLIKVDSVKGSSGDKMAASEPQPNPVIDKPAPKQVEPVAQAQTSTDEMYAAPVEIDIKSTNPSTTSTNQLEYAVELINSRRSADAEVLLRGLLGGIEDYSARKHLLALYSQQKLAGRERQLLLESMVRYPDDELFRTEYGRALFSAGSYREVIEFFVDGKAVNANQQALAAASHQRLDEHEEAVQYYGLALAQDATNARNWIGLGISQENTAAPRSALESYQ